MNEKRLHIGKPYVTEGKGIVADQSKRLCADVCIVGENGSKEKEKTFFFEFPSEFERYFCLERSDGFIMALLSAAMEKGYDIEVDAPISEKLYYQVSMHYIPTVCKYVDFMHEVEIIGTHDSVLIDNEGAVGTGCSGGVDSFSTIVSHTDKSCPENFRLTHLCYSSNGTLDSPAHEDRIIKNFKEILQEMKEIAKETGLALTPCYNNAHHFYNYPYKVFCEFYASIYAAPVFALQKLFSKYYESADMPLSEFDITMNNLPRKDFTINDLFSCSMLGTENLRLYSIGESLTRSDKVHLISDFKPAQQHLSVCGRRYEVEIDNNHNCGKCPKCINTMMLLDIEGKLDKFSNVFDIGEFEKNKWKKVAKMMSQKEKPYNNDLKAFAKSRHYRLPLSLYLYRWGLYEQKENLRKLLRNNKLAKKLYYKIGLDYKINGYRTARADEYVKEQK